MTYLMSKGGSFLLLKKRKTDGRIDIPILVTKTKIQSLPSFVYFLRTSDSRSRHSVIRALLEPFLCPHGTGMAKASKKVNDFVERMALRIHLMCEWASSASGRK